MSRCRFQLLWASCCLLSLLVAAGCQALPSLPYPFSNEAEPENPLEEWNGPLRGTTSSGGGAAVDVRSRQIERNLGIR